MNTAMLTLPSGASSRDLQPSPGGGATSAPAPDAVSATMTLQLVAHLIWHARERSLASAAFFWPEIQHYRELGLEWGVIAAALTAAFGVSVSAGALRRYERGAAQDLGVARRIRQMTALRRELCEALGTGIEGVWAALQKVRDNAAPAVAVQTAAPAVAVQTAAPVSAAPVQATAPMQAAPRPGPMAEASREAVPQPPRASAPQSPPPAQTATPQPRPQRTAPVSSGGQQQAAVRPEFTEAVKALGAVEPQTPFAWLPPMTELNAVSIPRRDPRDWRQTADLMIQHGWWRELGDDIWALCPDSTRLPSQGLLLGLARPMRVREAVDAAIRVAAQWPRTTQLGGPVRWVDLVWGVHPPLDIPERISAAAHRVGPDGSVAYSTQMLTSGAPHLKDFVEGKWPRRIWERLMEGATDATERQERMARMAGELGLLSMSPAPMRGIHWGSLLACGTCMAIERMIHHLGGPAAFDALLRGWTERGIIPAPSTDRLFRYPETVERLITAYRQGVEDIGRELGVPVLQRSITSHLVTVHLGAGTQADSSPILLAIAPHLVVRWIRYALVPGD